MIRIIIYSLFAYAFFTLTLLAKTTPGNIMDIEIIAKEFITQLAQEDFEKAIEKFDDKMASLMPSETLANTWQLLVNQVGPYLKHKKIVYQRIKPYDAVIVTCAFENADIGIKIVFDGNREIAGLYFLPPDQNAQNYQSPGYARRDSFIEKDIVINNGKWKLPGSLSIPKGPGPFPGAVLIHGSGPLDRDSTIGPNKPFRDLAWGLASCGIAVLRYEKRTRCYSDHYTALSPDFTVDEETVKDVLAAVSYLKGADKINHKAVFLIGHSMGGMLVPRIGARAKSIAGYVIMAGNSRPLEDLIYEQAAYLFNLDNTLSLAEKKQLKILESKVQRVKSQLLTPQTSPELLPFNLPAAYWLDLKGYDPVKEAAKLKENILVLQAEKDYQVPMADYERWKVLCRLKGNVTLKSFPSLNHLFIYENGKSKPASYQTFGHVHENVIKEISDFMQKTKNEKNSGQA